MPKSTIVQLDAGTNNAGNVGGISNVISATLTRPNNQTAYAAGDEITDTGGAIITLANIATKVGGGGDIINIGMSCSSGTPATGLEVWLFDTSSTPQTDNTAFAPADGVVDTTLKVVSLTATFQGTTGATGNVWYDSGALSIPYITLSTANLFLRLVTRAAYTAGAGSDTYRFRVLVWQNL